MMILDEVITGFRWSRGGAQKRFGVTPDLSCWRRSSRADCPAARSRAAKDIMDQLDREAATAAGREKIGHQGTFNANPLCSAAAIATLSIVEKEDVCAKAEATAEQIRSGMRTILSEEDVPWGVYGDASAFLISRTRSSSTSIPKTFDPHRYGFKELKAARSAEQKPPPAHRHAGERRRHHGGAGRGSCRRFMASARWRRRWRPSAPACAG